MCFLLELVFTLEVGMSTGMIGELIGIRAWSGVFRQHGGLFSPAIIR